MCVTRSCNIIYWSRWYIWKTLSSYTKFSQILVFSYSKDKSVFPKKTNLMYLFFMLTCMIIIKSETRINPILVITIDIVFMHA